MKKLGTTRHNAYGADRLSETLNPILGIDFRVTISSPKLPHMLYAELLSEMPAVACRGEC